jgi:hypothetical protein
MNFDAQRWRAEAVRLRERLRRSIDTARWLRSEVERTVQKSAQIMDTIHKARSARTLQALEQFSDRIKPPGGR